jgi:predicted nucleic acid-binding Zn ribbon protein
MAARGSGMAQDPATRLRALLPADLAPHLREVRVRDGVLVVYAESAAWGARLRLWLTEHIAANAEPLLPGLAPGARVTARVMPAGGYRK